MAKIDDDEIDKSLEDYFSHKPGEILTAPDNGKQYEIYAERYFTTSITSWRGISFGAIHWYAKIDMRGISTGDVGGSTGNLLGYLGGLKVERELTIEFTRVITDGERREDPDRFSKYQTRTNAFLTEEGAEQAIKDFLEQYKEQLAGWRNDDLDIHE